MSAKAWSGLSYAGPWIPMAAAAGTIACLYLLSTSQAAQPAVAPTEAGDTGAG